MCYSTRPSLVWLTFLIVQFSCSVVAKGTVEVATVEIGWSRVWVELNGEVKVLQSTFGVVEDAVGNGSVEENSVISTGSKSLAVAGDCLIKKRK